jgi:hypothetical protein
MARNLLLITGGVNLAQPRSPRQAVQAIALEDTRYACGRNLDVMVAGQVPNDAHRTQMVGLLLMKNLLDDLWRRAVL